MAVAAAANCTEIQQTNQSDDDWLDLSSPVRCESGNDLTAKFLCLSGNADELPKPRELRRPKNQTNNNNDNAKGNFPLVARLAWPRSQCSSCFKLSCNFGSIRQVIVTEQEFQCLPVRRGHFHYVPSVLEAPSQVGVPGRAGRSDRSPTRPTVATQDKRRRRRQRRRHFHDNLRRLSLKLNAN